jgi:thiamine biosynthesis lipoprotein ApbE
MTFGTPSARRAPVWLTLLSRVKWPAPALRTTHQERVLGTSLELQLTADAECIAAEAEAAALAEIERLEDVFSVYRMGSELRRWQQSSGTAARLSSELLQVLAAAECWRRATGGAFNPAVQALVEVWDRSAEREPSPEELAGVVAGLDGPQWSVDAQAGTATRLGSHALTLNAIAKGFIVDRACACAAAVPGVRSVLLNLGGDLRFQGAGGRVIGIADPDCDAENAPPLSRVRLQEGAVATSGGYRRGRRIGERWHSHLLDPRTGRPVEEIVCASVVAAEAMDADALATAFSVMTMEESLTLADSLPGVACLLVSREGTVRRSRGWTEIEIG